MNDNLFLPNSRVDEFFECFHNISIGRGLLDCYTRFTSLIYEIYIQTKVKQHHIFFGDTVLEVAERNMWVIEIKYFEFYCKFYYFLEHLELTMILSTKNLDYLRPFSKQVKNEKEKQWKKFDAYAWKIFFGLTFNRMESYHQLVYYKFFKILFFWCT